MTVRYGRYGKLQDVFDAYLPMKGSTSEAAARQLSMKLYNQHVAFVSMTGM